PSMSKMTAFTRRISKRPQRMSEIGHIASALPNSLRRDKCCVKFTKAMCPENIPANSSKHLSNGAIAAELMALAQLLAARGGNPFKAKAYRRAARTIRALGES